MQSGWRQVPVETGDSIGPYVLGRRLGAGGMGAVYAAMRDGRTFAIKIPYCELLAEDYAQRRFRDEGIAGSIVTHPNLARVLEYGESAGVPYLVMEQVEGPRLAVHRGLPSLRRAARIVQQLLEGLGALHDADIVHGDVKTDNVMLQDGTVKLIDFGLAHVAGDTPTTRIVSGTPDYMAPEVIRGHGSTPSSDIYAAGVILYELLTGATPFGGGASADIVRRHLTEDVVIPSLRRTDVEIPAILDRIVLRALAKEPRNRFASAAAFANALRVALPCLDDCVRTKLDRSRSRRGMRTVRRAPRIDSSLSTIDMPTEENAS